LAAPGGAPAGGGREDDREEGGGRAAEGGGLVGRSTFFDSAVHLDLSASEISERSRGKGAVRFGRGGAAGRDDACGCAPPAKGFAVPAGGVRPASCTSFAAVCISSRASGSASYFFIASGPFFMMSVMISWNFGLQPESANSWWINLLAADGRAAVILSVRPSVRLRPSVRRGRHHNTQQASDKKHTDTKESTTASTRTLIEAISGALPLADS